MMPLHAFPRLFRPSSFFSIVFVVAFSACFPAAANDASNRLGIPGPIPFDGTDYTLAWSSNPSPGYFKQEYLPAGQAVESFTSMVLVEAAAGADVNAALSAQMNMLNQRKPNDPLLNMDVIQNSQTGEALLDFLISSKDAQGEYVAEWNAYRYAPLPDGKGVMLFAISHRAYGNEEVRAFLGNLKTLRPDQINKVAQQDLPKPTLP